MLKIDTSDFLRAARNLERTIDQLPFAFSRAMNDAAKATRFSLIQQTWPSAVKVKRPNFLPWALRIKFSNKRNLTIEINDEHAQGRGNLELHADGGAKTVRGRVAVPGKYIKVNGRGVPRNLQPRNLPNSFRRGDIIYQRYQETKKKGGKRGLKLMYSLKDSVRIKQDVPFHRDFERVFREEFMKAAPKRIEEAFATMKRR